MHKIVSRCCMSMRAHQLDNFRRRKEELWRHRNLGAMPHSARFVGNLYKVSYFDATCDAHTSPNESPRRSASTSESRPESWAKSTSHTRSESKAESGSESSDDTPNVTNVTIRRRRRPVAIPWRHTQRSAASRMHCEFGPRHCLGLRRPECTSLLCNHSRSL